MAAREFLKSNPWLGWVVSLLLLVLAVGVYFKGTSNSAADSLERRSQMVTIRCTETGNEWQVNRGQFERLLMTHDGMIDPTKGIPSEHAEGRLTGVLVDTDDWTETVDRINAMKKAYQD